MHTLTTAEAFRRAHIGSTTCHCYSSSSVRLIDVGWVGSDRGDQPLRRKRARATTPPVGVLMHSPGKALSSAAEAGHTNGGHNGRAATGGTREGSEESTLAPAAQPADRRKGAAARTGMAATATAGPHGTPKADMAEAVSVLQVSGFLCGRVSRFFPRRLLSRSVLLFLASGSLALTVWSRCVWCVFVCFFSGAAERRARACGAAPPAQRQRGSGREPAARVQLAGWGAAARQARGQAAAAGACSFSLRFSLCCFPASAHRPSTQRNAKRLGNLSGMDQVHHVYCRYTQRTEPRGVWTTLIGLHWAR